MANKRRTWQQTSFGDYLDVLLEAREYSVRSFARHIGVSPSTVTNYKRRPPPADSIEGWADALGLRGEERDRFLELGWLANTPVYIRERYLRLEVEVNRLRSRVK